MGNLSLPFGVRVSSSEPIDSDRYIAADQAAMDYLITTGRAHAGLQVFNESDKTVYFLEILGATPALSSWTPISSDTGTPGTGVEIPPNMARVSDFNGDDITGTIGEYDKPFKTVTAAVAACRAAILGDNGLAGKLVVNVELGTYIDQTDLVFAGTLQLDFGVQLYGDDTLVTFDVSDTAFSGLSNQIFYLQGGGFLYNVAFDHVNEAHRHTIIVKCDYIQWRALTVASQFILAADYMEVTNNGTIYLVDSIDIRVKRVHVAAGVDVSPFILNPATTPGTLENNSSLIYFGDVEVEPTGRIYVTRYSLDPFERHIIDVRMDSGKGDIVMMFPVVDWESINGDLVLNYTFTLLHDNPIDSNTSSTKFFVGGSIVLTIDANITNYGYLQRGLLIYSHDDSVVNATLDYTSYSSQRTLYLETKQNGQLTVDGVVASAASGSETGIYVYSPNEAPYDDVDNASNIYFKNVVLRNMNDFSGGYGLYCWSGAYHNITILGAFSMLGLWAAEKHGNISYTYNTILPTSADMTRELVVATAGQTVFPSMYKLIDDRLQVIMNGITLGGDDYSVTATDMTLGLGAVLDDEITLISFDADPNVYEMTEWAQTGPVSADSVVLAPITFITAPTNPAINAILTGPDLLGDGVRYNAIPYPEDPTAYLSYNIVEDATKTVQLISVRFSARVQDAGDSGVIVKVQASNDNFVSNWESPEYTFTTEGYVTKEWYLSGRLFSPDKDTSIGIQIRVLIYTVAANIGQGIYFNNFKLKGYHKLT